jgi:hypothetical protein
LCHHQDGDTFRTEADFFSQLEVRRSLRLFNSTGLSFKRQNKSEAGWFCCQLKNSWRTKNCQNSSLFYIFVFENGLRYHIEDEPEGNSLVVRAVQPAHQGLYICQVTDRVSNCFIKKIWHLVRVPLKNYVDCCFRKSSLTKTLFVQPAEGKSPKKGDLQFIKKN